MAENFDPLIEIGKILVECRHSKECIAKGIGSLLKRIGEFLEEHSDIITWETLKDNIRMVEALIRFVEAILW